MPSGSRARRARIGRRGRGRSGVDGSFTMRAVVPDHVGERPAAVGADPHPPNRTGRPHPRFAAALVALRPPGFTPAPPILGTVTYPTGSPPCREPEPDQAPRFLGTVTYPTGSPPCREPEQQVGCRSVGRNGLRGVEVSRSQTSSPMASEKLRRTRFGFGVATVGHHDRRCAVAPGASRHAGTGPCGIPARSVGRFFSSVTTVVAPATASSNRWRSDACHPAPGRDTGGRRRRAPPRRRPHRPPIISAPAAGPSSRSVRDGAPAGRTGSGRARDRRRAPDVGEAGQLGVPDARPP